MQTAPSSLHVAQHADDLLTVPGDGGNLVASVEGFLVGIGTRFALLDHLQRRAAYYVWVGLCKCVPDHTLCCFAGILKGPLIFIALVASGRLRCWRRRRTSGNKPSALAALEVRSPAGYVDLRVWELPPALLDCVLGSCGCFLFLYTAALRLEPRVRIALCGSVYRGLDGNEGRPASCAK
jgi:hypothetical protein